LATPYEIGISYFPRVRFGGAILWYPWVTVQVLDPMIDLDPRGTGERPPHIYRRPDTRIGWSLCLYDPRKGEWQPDQPIAETIIPWAAEWLFFYEGWLIDGHWAGGGEHPDTDRSTQCFTPAPSCHDRPDTSLAAAFLKIGRGTGTFASSLSMAAASGDFSLQACLPNSKPWSIP